MTPENQEERLALNDKPMSAWEAAAAMGIDMSLIESSLSATPDDRLVWHDQALKTVLLLEQGAKGQHG